MHGRPKGNVVGHFRKLGTLGAQVNRIRNDRICGLDVDARYKVQRLRKDRTLRQSQTQVRRTCNNNWPSRKATSASVTSLYKSRAPQRDLAD